MMMTMTNRVILILTTYLVLVLPNTLVHSFHFIPTKSKNNKIWTRKSNDKNIISKQRILTKSTSVCVFHSLKNNNNDENNNDLIENHNNNSSEEDIEGKESHIIKGVTLKMAFDQNWCVAPDKQDKNNIPERFTSPPSLDLVHRLRRCSDCILVGRGTAQEDDCSLTVRRVIMSPEQQQPVRVVIDTNLSILNDGRKYQLLNDGLPTIIYCSTSAMTYHNDSRQILLPSCITLVPIEPENNSKQRLNPKSILKDLSSKGMHHIMVEGGPNTARDFIKSNLVDRAIMIYAPITFPGNSPIPSLINEKMLHDANLRLVHTFDSDGDVVKYWIRDGLSWPTITDNYIYSEEDGLIWP